MDEVWLKTICDFILIACGCLMGSALTHGIFYKVHRKAMRTLVDEYALLGKRHKALDELYRRCAVQIGEAIDQWKGKPWE